MQAAPCKNPGALVAGITFECSWHCVENRDRKRSQYDQRFLIEMFLCCPQLLMPTFADLYEIMVARAQQKLRQMAESSNQGN